MDTLSKKALSATKYTLLFRITSQGLGAVSTVFLVRALSKHNYGVYNLLYSIIPLLGMILSLGIANALQRYLPEYYHRGEFRLAHRLYCVSSLLRLLANLGAILLIVLFWDRFGSLFKIVKYKEYFLLFTIVIVLYMQRGILETCLGSYFLQKYSQGIAVIFSLIRAVGYGVAIFAHWTLWHILLIDVLSHLLIFFLLQIAYLKKIPTNIGTLGKFPGEERRRILRYALFYNFNDVGVGVLDAKFDNFVIAAYLDPISVGAYAFCQRIVGMLQQLLPTNYLQVVLRPFFFAGLQDQDPTRIKQWFQILLKATYLFYFPFFVFILCYGRDLIRLLFAGKFLEYHLVLVGVAGFALLNAFQVPVGLVAQLKERSEIIFYSKVFALYNLLADIVLVYIWGIWGAVIATGSATLCKNIFIWFYVRREAAIEGMGSFVAFLVSYWIIVGIISAFLLSSLLKDSGQLPYIGTALFALAFVVQFRFIPLNDKDREIVAILANNMPRGNVLLRLCGLGKTG